MSTSSAETQARWQQSNAVEETAPPSSSRGLIGRLLEEGRLSQEWVALDGTYSVETRVFFDIEKAWLFRCAVSRDGVEMTDPPWQCQMTNLTTEMIGQAATEALKIALARRALENHLSRVRQVSVTLQSRGTLMPSSNRFPLWHRWTWISIGALLGFLILAAAVWKVPDLNQLWHASVEKASGILPPPSTIASSRAGDGVAPSPVVAEPPVANLDRPAIDPEPGSASTSPPEQASGEPSPERRSALPETERAHVTPAPTSRRSPPAASATRRPSTGTKAEASSPPRAQASSPATKSDVVEPASPPASAPAEERPSAPTARSRLQALASDIEPSATNVFFAEPGVSPYSDSSLRWSEIPQSVQGLTCLSTRQMDGDTQQGIFVRLIRPATVFIAHHNKVKKTPAWLDDFSAQGDTLEALEVDQGETITYNIYRRDYSAGAIALGANNGARKWTRKLRDSVGKKELVMYVVCLR